MAKDHNNYDYLAVSVKSDQLSRILHCYRALGWTEIKTEEDRQYYDMNYVRLRRPHRIANKDRLQYLQVRMENSINSLVAITNRAHIKSNGIAAAGTLATLAIAALGLWLVIARAGALRIFGWVCVGLSLAVAIAATVAVYVMRRREKKAATAAIIEKLRLTQSLIDEAASLSPADTEASEGLYDLVESADGEGGTKNV